MRFPNNPAYASLYASEIPELQKTGFVIHSPENGCSVYLLNNERTVVRSEAPALFCDNALFWNGHGYILKDSKFIRRPWKLFCQKDVYLLMELGDVLWVLYANGKIDTLGRLKEKFRLKTATFWLRKRITTNAVITWAKMNRNVLFPFMITNKVTVSTVTEALSTATFSG